MTDRCDIVEAVSPEQRQVAYSIRFRSYRAIGEIDDCPEPFLSDPYDHEDHYKVFVVNRNDSPAATVRVGVYTLDFGWKPLACFGSFAGELSSYIGCGQPLVEAGRLAIAPELRSTDFSLVSLLFERVHGEAERRGAKWVLMRARKGHVGFWRRLSAQSLSAEKDDSPLRSRSRLLIMDAVRAYAEFNSYIEQNARRAGALSSVGGGEG
jgi:hypothetical protein